MRFTRKDGLIYGVGTLGFGKYDTVTNSFAYKSWFNILERCYNHANKYKSYQDCIVCEEWKNFQNFAEFYYGDHYRKNGWHLDKDLLVKKNRIYSPERCAYVPPEINKMLVKRYIHRGNTPIGVVYESKRKTYKATMHCYGKTHNLGRYHTVEEAFYAYKKAKELHIREVAEKYKGDISPRVYDALINYTVEITD
ncbi:hypothetical protein A3BBH6_05870 [Alistipes onderdonkii subsp. vulgaris]|uniref:hypothetical protein n=1 Tax=Alistipes onderdonkii TaxID=328813 RepID=UPI0011415745|nr:hypothetical protein [Alistipes onderdonkii]BBL00351.1 hypothetical protein A3BBH6_05870 [Alistipes onderdonkii subsp. vulgaris]